MGMLISFGIPICFGFLIGTYEVCQHILGLTVTKFHPRKIFRFGLNTIVIGSALFFIGQEINLFWYSPQSAIEAIAPLIAIFVLSAIINLIHINTLKRMHNVAGGKTLIASGMIGLTTFWGISSFLKLDIPAPTLLLGGLVGLVGGIILSLVREERKDSWFGRSSLEIIGGSIAGMLSWGIVAGTITLTCGGWAIVSGEISPGEFVFVGLLWIFVMDLISIFIGILGGMVFTLTIPLQYMMQFSSRMSFRIIRTLVAPLRFKTIICKHCLRYTFPLQARYKHGKRYCERCQHEVEDTRDSGKVLVMFGKMSLKPKGRVFMLANPDFERKKQSIDITAVYIDPETCDLRLFERFLTYIVNYPPRFGLQSVQVFCRGKPEALGGNLKNSLRNTFITVRQI